MKIAFAAFRYFPWGGLEKDLLRTALCAAERGHDCTIFTGSWSGPVPEKIQVRILPVHALSNHRKSAEFAKTVLPLVRQERFDVFAAFNRIPGADFYFCADDCQYRTMREKHSETILRLLPRYRTFLALEKALFSPGTKTIFWSITEDQQKQYTDVYGTEPERFQLLPPGMDPRCRRTPDAAEIRTAVRREFGVPEEDLLFLLAGSNPLLKGGDRAVRAIGMMPPEFRCRVHLFFAGSRTERHCRDLARKLSLENQIRFLGPRNDIPRLMFASDAVLLPSRHDATGTVLVEGISAGTPVLCSSECGFAPYVREAGGFVIPSPWDDKAMTDALVRIVQHRDDLLRKAVEYSRTVDFTGRDKAAVDSMEAFFDTHVVHRG